MEELQRWMSLVPAREWSKAASKPDFPVANVAVPRVAGDACVVSEPASPAQPQRRRWRPPGPPENEVPQLVAVPSLLGRGPDAAMFLTAAVPYSTGVAFSIGLRLRHHFDERRSTMHAGLMGMPAGESSSEDPDGRLMLGVELFDRRRAVMTLGFPPPQGPEEPADPGAVSLVSLMGGGFGGISSDVRYWLRPLPPPGPLLVVLRWTALGIAETVTELDGSALAAAGASAIELWPPVPHDDPQPPPTPPPPTSGWFATSSQDK